MFSNLEGVPMYGKILIFLPAVLVVSGGLVGGLCGGTAIAVNMHYWKQKMSTTSKVLISIASLFIAGFVAIMIAGFLMTTVFK